MSANLDLTPFADTVKELEPYFRHWISVLSAFLKEFRRETGIEVRLFVFGSVLEGRAFPGLSDIDVLVLSEEGRRLQPLFLERFRRHHPFHPFEFHFVDQKLFEEWYTRFVKRFEEIA